MASYFGVNSDYSSSFFSSMLGTKGSNSTASTFSSLGDYSLIKSGVYKKLMTAYYEKTDSDSSSSDSTKKNTTTTKANTDTENVKLTSAKSDAEKLKSAATALKKVDTSDEIKVATGLKDFVSAYNLVLTSAQNTSNTYIAQKGDYLKEAVKQNASLLKSLGITTSVSDTLTFDETKIKGLDASTLQSNLSSLFSGSGSFGDSVTTKANQIYSLASANIYSNTHTTTYTNQGNYNLVDTQSLYSSLF